MRQFNRSTKSLSFLYYFVCIALFFSLFILAPCTSNAMSDMSDISQNMQEDKKIVRIGFQPERAFYATTGTFGQEGYGYEYMTKLLYYAKNEYSAQYVPVNWQQGLEMLKKGELDLMPFASFSEERAKEFLYSKKPIIMEKPVLLSLKADSPHISTDYRELHGKKICVYTYNVDYDNFLDFLNKNDIYALLLKIPYKPIAELKREGEYDYILSSSLLLGHNIVSAVGLESKPSYILGHKDNAELMADIDYAMNALETNDLLFERKLFIKYYNNFAQKTEYLSDEQRKIMQGQVFHAGVMNMNAPISFITDDGEVAGGFVDVVNLLAKRGQFNVIFHKLPAYASMSEINKFDFSLLPYIQKNIDPLPLSDVFASNPIVLLQGKVKKEEGKYTIGTLEHFHLNYTFVSSCLVDQPDEYIEYHTTGELIKAFLAGEIDDAIITRAIFNTSYATLSPYVLTDLGFEYNVTISFRQDFPKEKIKIINSLISQVDQATLDDITTRNVALMTRHSASYYFIKYWYIVLITFCAMAIIFLVVHRKSQKQKAYELKLANDINPVTGLYTFQKFLAEARVFITNNPYAQLRVIVLDIDHFSYINELFGFNVGTKVLQQLAYHIKEVVKETSPIAHYGGDDFAFITFKHSADAKELLHNFQIEKLKKSLDPSLAQYVNFSLSFGVYDVVDRDAEISSMVDCAKIACNKSKEVFGSHVEFYTEEMKQESILQNQMLNLIKKALENKEFELFYQPKFDIDRMHVVGAEALIRWFRDGKMISPDSFIPIAERHGLISEIDYHVIELACQFINKYATGCLPHISINISGFTIIKSELVTKLIEITKKYNVSPKTIDIEITETALVNNFDMALKQIVALRELGFTISMDDFGTGVSSLNRLSKMPLDTIKLDRVFIMDAMENAKSSVVVQTVIELAKRIEAKTVAEGIETVEQLELLRSLSCEHGQGYFYARPMSENNFLAYLDEASCKEPRK